METVRGLAAARGFAVGPVFVFRGSGAIPIPEYVVEPGCDGDELLRFKRALYEAKRDLETLISALYERNGQTESKVFECHQMLMEDPVLIGQV